jgi:hypothetical protein
MVAESKKPDIGHLAWAIDQRAEIQRTLLALYEFVRRRRPPQPFHENYVLGYLIGAAFSLWRAVFLAETFRDDVSIHGSQENFLEKVITDNAIGFNDDKQNRHWTVGYYLENAKFRLSNAIGYVESHATAFGLDDKPGLAARLMPFLRLTGTMGVEMTRYEWETAHYVLRCLFKVIEPKTSIEAKKSDAPKPSGLEEFLREPGL